MTRLVYNLSFLNCLDTVFWGFISKPWNIHKYGLNWGSCTCILICHWSGYDLTKKKMVKLQCGSINLSFCFKEKWFPWLLFPPVVSHFVQAFCLFFCTHSSIWKGVFLSIKKRKKDVATKNFLSTELLPLTLHPSVIMLSQDNLLLTLKKHFSHSVWRKL